MNRIAALNGPQTPPPHVTHRITSTKRKENP